MLPQTNMFRENRPFERKLVFQPLLFNGFREGSWKILRSMFSVIFDGHPEFLRVKNHHEIELINTTTPKIHIAPRKIMVGSWKSAFLLGWSLFRGYITYMLNLRGVQSNPAESTKSPEAR